ncbi:MAG: penicillin-binding protein 2 [Deltaproteobacteria bacterium]|nr:penicillin-binding protein 2 [Deltaproteobacteria bacterium]
MGLNPNPEQIPGLRRRFSLISLFASCIFIVMLLRLWQLQILAVDHYRDLSERNRIRYVSVEPPRGSVYDRNCTLLVDNRPSFTVSVLRQDLEDISPTLQSLGTLLGINHEQLHLRWQSQQHLPKYQPVPLIEDIDRDAMERVQENALSLPAILVEVKPMRSYPYGDLAAHLFGYLGEVTEEELRAARFFGYRSGVMIGKTGLERLYESELRGETGEKRIEVNVKGREMRQVTTQEPLPGHSIVLSLDLHLQKVAEDAFGDQAGAVVVMDVTNGDILAFTSKPSYDPSVFARGISSKEWNKLINNPQKPMINKALRGQYPPGSTFKMVVALAALEAGSVHSGTTIHCSGSIALGDSYEYRCWKKEGHGRVNLHKALKESCDVWFYQVGMELGIEKIASAARRLGLGAPLEFPFGDENPGLIPDTSWKRKRFGTSWYVGETVIASIGQGFVLTTPLQLAAMTSAIANGGTVWRPQLVKRILNRDGETVSVSLPKVLKTAYWRPDHINLVQNAMDAVVNEPGGTAWRSRLNEVRFAGKTGTAQVVKRKSTEEEDALEDQLDNIPYRLRDHALFVGYAPSQNPEIAIAVVVEHGGHGSSAAAPVAQAIFRTYADLKSTRKELADNQFN